MRSTPIKCQGFHIIVDLLPDGEAADQVPSREVARAAKERGIRFVYVPVPHDADGRAAWATVYSLPTTVIAMALENGGRDWLDSRRR